jgi:hypothetical protein
MGVRVPVAAERLPGLLLKRRHVRRGPGVEHQQAGLVVADQPLGERLAGGVPGHRHEPLAQFLGRQFQCAPVPGDPHDRGARGGQRGRDRAPETPAGPGDDGWH